MGKTKLTGSPSSSFSAYGEGVGVSPFILSDSQNRGLGVPLDSCMVFEIRVASTVVVPGAGGLSVGDSYSEVLIGAIKNVGGTTSIVGAVTSLGSFVDTDMATLVLGVTANDTDDTLQIEITPPSTADADTVIVASATVEYTVV